MIYSWDAWRQEKATPSQLNYIGKMTKEHPELPPFKGKTKGEAAVYIEKYKKVNRCKQSG